MKLQSVIHILVGIACFALLPRAQAVTPAPDGGYPDGNTAEGDDALFSLSTGKSNTAVGYQTLYSNTTGYENTAIGRQTLKSNTTGFINTAIGALALFANETGRNNTATGVEALHTLTTGFNNTATGTAALHDNRAGYRNTAIGAAALRNSTTGSFNTATGASALYGDPENGTSSGSNNTADGADALRSFTSGNKNTAVGNDALRSNTTGSDNTAVGLKALYTSNGNNNIALGLEAGVNLNTGDNNIDIGNKGVAGESDTIRIGTKKILKPTGPGKAPFTVVTRTFIAGIHKQNEGGVNINAVYVNSDGQLGTQAPSSSRRFKKEIKPMEQTSEAILGLKPVTFHYKSDTACMPQFGLIAEEVAEVNPDLVVRDENGEIYTVRYEAVNAMLLNEFLKEHRKVQELEAIAAKQEATTANQQKEIKVLTASLKEQAAQIQKVSTQLEASKSASQVVNNNQ
jgi:Chaperone of endosialidase